MTLRIMEIVENIRLASLNSPSRGHHLRVLKEQLHRKLQAGLLDSSDFRPFNAVMHEATTMLNLELGSNPLRYSGVVEDCNFANLSNLGLKLEFIFGFYSEIVSCFK